jgi:hypothetical protein
MLRSLRRAALLALVVAAGSLPAAPIASADDPSLPIPPDMPACQVADPPRVCLVDDHRQYQGRTARQDVAPMQVDLIVPATGYADLPVRPETVCVVLPDDTTAVTVSRRALVAEAGVDRPLVMTIRPFASTAHALAEMPIAETPSTLVTTGLGGMTCFSFENLVSSRAADGVAQAYLYFAQVVTIQSR